jgi:predicted RecA/RadA family phage recombinase
MKNYIQPGNVMTLTSVFGVKSGDPVLLNKFFGVANYEEDVPGRPIEVSVVGVYSLPKKPTAVFALGAPAYWDDAARNITDVASATVLVGATTEAAGSGVTTVAVRLNGIAVPAPGA